MVVMRSSETSDFTRVKRCDIPKDDILHSQRCENLKSYTVNDLGLLEGTNYVYSIKRLD
jgi:hypothetical protein